MSVYKIYDKNNEDNYYIGSTNNFYDRKINHKLNCKKKGYKLYNYINENGGWDCFKMEVLEYCLNYREREIELIKQLHPPLNTNWYNFNRKEYKKNYSKKYREENKEEINKKATQKITCECGCITTKRNIARHKKTKKHINLMT